MQQINYVLALQQADPAREARQHSVRQLTALGVHQTDAVEALKAAGGDFRQAAQALDFDLQVASRFVRAPIGLPNRSNDCFWLATVQCLRHVPGFAQTVTACTERALQRPPLNVAHALANLLLRMERQREADYLSLRCPELHDFIRICERNLPKDDGHALVQSNFQRQEQEDSNEFLNQLLNVLGEYAFQGGQDTGDPGPPPSRSASSLAVQEHARLRLLAIAEELTEASKEEDWGEVYKLVSEFADIQWDGSRLRLRSGIGELLEGQRLVVMECSACRRWSAGSADSFIMEEVRVQPKGARRGGGSGKVHNSLTSMLRGNTARDTPEGYRCDGCGAADTTAFRDGLRKLPKVYAVHINRTLPNGSRCSEPVQLEETLDLKDMLLYKQKGPIDHSNQPCASSYQLAAVTFHRGVSARSGHYIACVRDMSLGKSPTYRVAKPLKVTVDIAPSSAEVMQLEPGSSLVCLEEREHVGSGIVRRSTTRMLCQYGWVTPSAGSLARTSGWTELDDDEVSECGPGVTPQAIERSRAGARAAMLFYVRDELKPPEPDPGDAVGSPD
jgi:ubiquitin C-terminal hydrolase